MAVRTAVIPAAGMGTRFLPYTKASPKEMLPIIDRPTIEYIVEEAVRAGVADVLVITARGKTSIEDHFDRVPELEAALAAKGKDAELATVHHSTDMAQVHFVRQGEALGLGHAIGVARGHVGDDDAFVVMLGDDVIHHRADVISDMRQVHEATGGGHVVAVMEVPPEDISSYGCVAVETTDDGLLRVTDMVEKPPVDEAPSNLAVVGRYLLAPGIFDAIDATAPGAGGEIQLTDAISSFVSAGQVYATVIPDGVRYDVGMKSDYLRTIVEFGCEREDLGPEFKAFLTDFVANGFTSA